MSNGAVWVNINFTSGWSEQSRSLAFTAEIRQDKLLFHLILNPYGEPLEFELPPVGNDDGNPWRRWIDTAQETPNDIVPWREAPTVPGLTYRAEGRSVVALFAPIQCSQDSTPMAPTCRKEFTHASRE